MLKTTMLLQVLITDKMLAVDKVGGIEGSNELIEKCGKLSKTKKLSKSQKSAKLKKKLSKNGNLPNFDTQKNGLSFLTLNAKTAFNRL